MNSTTALTMVNRLLRRHGFEDFSAFTDPATLLALDLVNQAIRDLLSARDYPWNIRHDGAITLKAEQTGTATCTTSTTTFSISSFTPVIGDITGSTLVSKLIVEDATNHPNTPFRIASGVIAAGTLSGVFGSNFPEGVVSASDWRIIINEYVLPTSVSKVVSARYLERAIRVVELSPNAMWDDFVPNAHEVTGTPEIIGVGGTSDSTPETGTTATTGLRLMVYPVPNIKTVLHYSYKERLTDLSATTDTLTAPSEFVDDVIDRAEALSNMTQRFNAPDLAVQQLRNSVMTAERKWVNSAVDPNRRHSMRPHDTMPSRRDPTKYRDITGL